MLSLESRGEGTNVGVFKQELLLIDLALKLK